MKTFKEPFITEAKNTNKEFEKLDKQLSDIVKKMGPVYSKLVDLMDSADGELYNKINERLFGIEKLRTILDMG